MNQALSSTPTFEIVRQQRFEVGPRYTDLKFIGEGAYGATKRKSERPPVNRINSFSSRSLSLNIASSETIDNACLICTANAATHEYDPCQHFPMCQECCARLDQEQLQRCMHCFRPATIRMRVPTTPLTQ
ncbi:unnamed protein product [Rotaria sp. Silwood1]|nr:unnamed protein product [Rotaria sp. Silwood1]